MNKHIILLYTSILLVPLILADTGTYEIAKEYADLIVNTDGAVTISYDITFVVTGGNIPWVTVGLPNSNFNILSFSGTASSVSEQNSLGWSGVYIDLDKKYLVGDSFSFGFKVQQKGLIVNDNGKASLVFIPAWWDNAVIKDLRVSIQPPPNVKEVDTILQATSMEDNKVVWQWNDVEKGKRYTVGILMPIEAFPSLNETSVFSPISSGTFLGIPLIFILIAGGIFFGIILKSKRRFYSSSYDSPSISIGGDDEVTRHINMDCPNGHGRLDKKEIEGVTIDYCPKCGGTQFDKGEIESLIKKEVNEVDFDKRVNVDYLKDIKEGNIKCPRCDGQMYKKSKDVDGKEVAIFVCEDCEGLWINKGNYQIIKDKRLEQEKLQDERKKKREDEDDDTWIYPVSWWIFASNIGATGSGSSVSFSGGEFGGGGSSYSSSASVSTCVSCACVAAACCACACAGGGAAGCSAKNKAFVKGIRMEDLHPEKRKI